MNRFPPAFQDILKRKRFSSDVPGFLNLSFFIMCATVVINLVVGALDQRGRAETGDLVDRRCRWLFPVTYFGLLVLMVGVTFLFF